MSSIYDLVIQITVNQSLQFILPRWTNISLMWALFVRRRRLVPMLYHSRQRGVVRQWRQMHRQNKLGLKLCLTRPCPLALNKNELRRKVELWIEERYGQDSTLFSEAFLFGSLVRGMRATRDVDLLLIARARPGTNTWIGARTVIEAWKSEVEEISDRPISVTLLTESAWMGVRAWFATEGEQLG